MKTLLAALMLVAASLNVVACASHAAQETTDTTTATAEERADRAEAMANDSLRK